MASGTGSTSIRPGNWLLVGYWLIVELGVVPGAMGPGCCSQPIVGSRHALKGDYLETGLVFPMKHPLFGVMFQEESNCHFQNIHLCKEFFGEGFFKTTFWIVWSTTFGFQPCHSVAEFRRCLHRFYNDFDELKHCSILDRTRFNHHESIVVPITHVLQHEGVGFRFHTKVTDIVTDPTYDHRHVSTIRYIENGPEKIIEVGQNDIVIVSLGSVMSGSTRILRRWNQWAQKTTSTRTGYYGWNWRQKMPNSEFGNAYNFCMRMSESRLESFTVTLRNPTFFNRFIDLTDDEPYTGALVTLKDSNWLFSLSIPHQPLFPNQPEHVQVF
ncbi:uncharacterized protein ASPGLDRAFT_33842 [Aspergillus glaucus CBS 516.65]|uniref:Uncharacterized protein n=1 Tax=Aspergillus glaucus CBS 516.65 TaxID=1160497 RepID=A0A1L9VPS8_ASPGL|nr:hypothetical protein ASPGLDRAFT_33842 [Aspergillus glaucus CBS 516.65]OJJ85919.1 hypothetical protein ASPGLDRAFT_33842 [Aspergillus glaucus CBS 516.65]